MPDAVIVALIALAGQIVIALVSNSGLLAKLDKASELADQRLDGRLEKYQAVTDAKIETLTAEVRKHNGFAEKIPVLEEKMKVANKRIDDLERR